MDVLADLLERSRARGAAFAHTTLHGPWGIELPTMGALAVHTVFDGEMHLESGQDVRRLGPGDVTLVRGSLPHRLVSAPGTSAIPLARLEAECAVVGSPRRFHDQGTGERAVFTCGAYRFAGDLCTTLLRALPDVLTVRPAAGSPLRAALDLLAAEMERDVPGQQTILDRLLDIALVGVLREHFSRAGNDAPVWYRALDDTAAGPALRAMHADPAQAWTVASLASTAGLSRAAFARRFAGTVGQSPLEYLTGWRMALAREALRDTDDGLAAIGPSVGYASEFAFAAAFKRHHGVAPGRWRIQAREIAAA